MPLQDAGKESGTRHVFETAAARPGITFLLFLAVLLPAMIAFGILNRQALSAPYQDDYAVILGFATTYHQSPSLKNKVLHVATDQDNEYKLGFEHSIVAAELELTHHLNFAFLNALGNAFLMAIGYLLWRIYRKDEQDLAKSLLAFLPISLLFFSLTYWENLNWTTTDLQNIPVIFFSLLAIYFLFPGRRFPPSRMRMLLACLAAALAAFTSANGFLLGPVGLLILLPRRAYAMSLAWCAGFVAPLAAYLYHYTVPVHPANSAAYLTRPLFFLGFLGCGAIPFRWPAALAGIVILIILWLALRSRFDRINPVAFYFVVWIIATASLVAWVRGAMAFAVLSRYSIYSILLLIFCYSFLAAHCADRWRKRFYLTCLVVAMGIFLLANLHAYQKLGERRRMVLTGMERYRENPAANSPLNDSRVEKAYPLEKAAEQAILTRAIQEHIYSLPR